MIKQKRLLSLILLLTILLSGLTTGVYAEQKNTEDGFKEWDEVHSVDSMKKWTIIFNQKVNPSTVNDDNIYVTNHLGQKEDTRAIMGSDEGTVILQPPRGGYSSEYDYTLYIENVFSKQDKKLKDNIAMKFFIEDDEELQLIKFLEDIINMEVGDSKKLGIIGVYKNRVTGNKFEAPIDSGVEYFLNPSDSASIDSAGNIKILTDENREIEVTARYKGREGRMVVYVEKQINFAKYSNMIYSSGSSTMALKKDGTVWVWGVTLSDGLHIGGEFIIKEQSSIPIQVEGLNNVAKVSEFLVLKKDGTVWTWGDNTYGQLGNGANNYSETPVQAKGLSDVTDISTDGLHCMALKKDGTVWTWGYNGSGELGNGTVSSDWEGIYNDSNVPIQTKRLNDVIAVLATWHRSTALKRDGTVWIWGFWSGNKIDIPIQVKGLENVIAISENDCRIMVLKENGTVWRAEGPRWGELEDGTNSFSATPVQVRELNDVVAISANWECSMALKGDGTVWAWGDNGYGQLGDGTNNRSDTPVQVKGLKNVVAISNGTALKRDGTVWTWGDNCWGQLGNGTYEDSNVPVQALIKLW